MKFLLFIIFFLTVINTFILTQQIKDWKLCNPYDTQKLKIMSLYVIPSTEAKKGQQIKSDVSLELLHGTIQNGKIKVFVYNVRDLRMPLFVYEYKLDDVVTTGLPIEKGTFKIIIKERVPFYAFSGTYVSKTKLYIENKAVACVQRNMTIAK